MLWNLQKSKRLSPSQNQSEHRFPAVTNLYQKVPKHYTLVFQRRRSLKLHSDSSSSSLWLFNSLSPFRLWQTLVVSLQSSVLLRMHHRFWAASRCRSCRNDSDFDLWKPKLLRTFRNTWGHRSSCVVRHASLRLWGQTFSDLSWAHEFFRCLHWQINRLQSECQLRRLQ